MICDFPSLQLPPGIKDPILIIFVAGREGSGIAGQAVNRLFLN